MATFIFQFQISFRLSRDGLVHPVLSLLLFWDAPPSGRWVDLRDDTGLVIGTTQTPKKIEIFDYKGKSIYRATKSHFKPCNATSNFAVKSCSSVPTDEEQKHFVEFDSGYKPEKGAVFKAALVVSTFQVAVKRSLGVYNL